MRRVALLALWVTLCLLIANVNWEAGPWDPAIPQTEWFQHCLQWGCP